MQEAFAKMQIPWPYSRAEEWDFPKGGHDIDIFNNLPGATYSYWSMRIIRD